MKKYILMNHDGKFIASTFNEIMTNHYTEVTKDIYKATQMSLNEIETLKLEGLTAYEITFKKDTIRLKRLENFCNTKIEPFQTMKHHEIIFKKDG